MALPFLDNKAKKMRDQMIAVDLGSRTSKAVYLQRRGEALALCSFALLDAPIFEKNLSADLLTEHLKAVSNSLGAKTKWLTLTIGVNESLVRPVDMPRIPVEELRLILKHNSRNYLQQDLSSHVFDCFVVPPWNQAEPSESTAPAGVQKQKVMVAGAKQTVVDDFVEGARRAGLTPDHIVPALIGPVNAFEMAMPDVFKNQAVALVDVGFRNSTICLLNKGELILSRVVNIGGDRLTTALSESMNISYAEAEGIKIGVAHEVQPTLESSLTPLGRELRASIDFFEHQHDKTISQAFISGGSSRSDVILQALQTELMIECKTWDPTHTLKMDLPPQQAAEIEQVAPQLAVAIGAALAAL